MDGDKDMPARQQTGLLVLRVAVGLIFFAHGCANLLAGREAFLRAMLAMAGWSAPDVLVWLLTAIELLGGLALLLGVFTRGAALVLSSEMIGAVALFSLREGFLVVAVPNVPLAYAFEYPLALIGALVCLALAGPGRFALDNWLSARESRSAGDGDRPRD